MITNATITGIASPGTPDRAGKIVYPSPTTVNVPALLTGLSKRHLIELATLKIEATAQVRVLKSTWQSAGVADPKAGVQLTIAPYQGATRTLVVTDLVATDKGAISSFRMLCTEGRK